MGWERSKALTMELSPAPSLLWWLLAGALTTIVGVLLFILHASQTVKLLSVFSIWWVSLTPSSCWLFLFCLRGWLWSREVDKYEFLIKEEVRGQKKWQEWAERYVAILGSCVLLPDGVTSSVVNDVSDSGLPPQNALCRRIAGYSNELDNTIQGCLRGVQATIQRLPEDLPLNVIFVTDVPVGNMAEIFAQGWKASFPERTRPEHILVTDNCSLDYVEARLKQPVLTVDLILVIQLNGKEEYSDGVAALLLTSDDVAQKYQLPHRARLLRPMPLKMNMFKEDVSLFLETQIAACHTTRILADSVSWETVSAPLFTAGAACGTTWQPAERIVLEKWCGIPGPLAPWLLTALAAELVNIGNNSLLTLFSSGEEHFISTVTSGSEDEHIG